MPASATSKRRKPKRLSRTHKPEHLDARQWQLGLRREFAGEQKLRIENTGPNEVFSEYAVSNPQTSQAYRVVIRGEAPGMNFCSCPDYAVNTLGTCKHIEATLRRLRRRHAGALARGHQPPFSEIHVRYGVRREIVFAPSSDCPANLLVAAGRCFDAQRMLKPEGLARLDHFLRAAARCRHELRVYDDAAALVAKMRDDALRRERLHERFGGRRGAARLDRLLKTALYPYQKEGALFAARAGRSLLADDMGLGKTVQAIAAAEILARECGLERVLIVCPTSLKSQWKQEIERFCSRSALIIEGLGRRRAELYAASGAFFKIVNYDVVHRDLPAIAAWEPELVILDEAQRIKNWQTRASQAVKRIASPYALVLTGTPLENRIEELHSIVEFVDRYRLGPLFAFKDAHEIHEEDSSRVIGYRNLQKISRTLAPILLRRRKHEVLEQLPGRMDKNYFVPMTAAQLAIHDEYKEVVARLVQKWRRFKFLSEEDQLRLRIALQMMRMSCDSTYLVDHCTRHGNKVQELRSVLEEIFEDRAAKVVIFSQWLRMNELVAEMLEGGGWGHVHLHGGVPGGKRQDLIRRLREDDDCRVFLSTDAGGVGLNLQRAHVVINMDLPWNPAVLEQRIGRVHRLGQKQPVRVVNFIAEGTIEHGILGLLAFKKSVFAGVLDGAEDKVMMGTGAMERFIKTIETATASVPAVEPTPESESDPESPDANSNGHRETATPAGGPRRSGASSAPHGRPRHATRDATRGRSAAAAGRRQNGAPSTGPEDAGAAAAMRRQDGAGAGQGLDRGHAQPLGALLMQGAALLQNVAQMLTAGGTFTEDAEDGPASAGAHVAVDARTGRRELRLALPDEQTLGRWMAGLAQAVAVLRGGS